MKSKIITSSLALLSLGMMGEVIAEEGRNNFEVTLNADLSKTVSEDNVQIRLYNQGTQLSEGRLNVDLQQTMNGKGSIIWGGSGISVSGRPGLNALLIDPENIYVVEIYSNNNITFKSMIAGCLEQINLQHSSGDENILTGVCGSFYPLGGQQQLYTGNSGQVPNKLTQVMSAPLAFTDAPNMSYTIPEDIVAGDALYFPVAFYAHLPEFGSNLSKYQPGLYTGNGSMVITASWK